MAVAVTVVVVVVDPVVIVTIIVLVVRSFIHEFDIEGKDRCMLCDEEYQFVLRQKIIQWMNSYEKTQLPIPGALKGEHVRNCQHFRRS